MKLLRLGLAVAVLFAVSLPGAARAEDTRESREAVQDVVKAYTVACNDSDVESLAGLYTQDAYWLPPNFFGPVIGRKLIKEIQTRHLKETPTVKRKTLRIDISDELAYVVGTFSNNRESAYGNFVLCLRKQADGKWLIVSDISNTARTPPGPVLLGD